MVKKRLKLLSIFLASIFFLSTVIPGITPGAKASVMVTLELSRYTAQPGDSVTAAGMAGADTWVSVKVLDSGQGVIVFDAVRSDAEGNYSCPFKISNTAAGTLTVVAGYGVNVASKTIAVSATPEDDTTAPSWIDGSLTPSNVTQSGLTLTWSGATDDVGVTGYKVYQGSTLLTTTPVTGDSYNVTGLNPGTEYTFTVQAVDAAGNESADGPNVDVTTETGDDTTAPTWINGTLDYSDLSQSGMTLSWSGATDNVGVTGYNVYQGSAKLNGSPVSESIYTVVDLSPDTEYTFTVQAVDGAGNESADGPSVPVRTLVSTVSVTLELSQYTAQPGDSVTAAGTADADTWVSVKVLDSGQGVIVFDAVRSDAGGNYSCTFKISNTAAGTLTVVAGYGVNVANKTIAVGATPEDDTTAPSWIDGSLTPSNVTQSGLTLTWSGATDDVGVTGYKVYQGSTLLNNCSVNGLGDMVTTLNGSSGGSAGGGGGGGGSPSPVVGDSYNVTDLNPGTEYTFTVQAVDAAGNESTDGPSVDVTTETGDDTTAPTWINGTLDYSDLSQSGMTLSWSGATDNEAVTGYNVYQGSAKLNDSPVSESSYTVVDLSPDTEYTFTVQAVDGAGNESADGPSVPVRTLVSTVSVTLELSQYTAQPGDSVTAAGTADADTWVSVKVLDSGQGVIVFDAVRSDAGGNYSCTFKISNTAAGTLTVVAGYGVNVANKTIAVGTTPEDDTTAPSWIDGSLTPSNVTQSGLTLTWSGATDDVGVTGYKVYQDSTLLTTTPVTGDSYNVTGLNPGTEYTFTVQAVDAAGNESTDGPSVDVTTAAYPTPVIADYKVKINGTEVQTDLPIVEMDGIVMGPVRSVADALGIQSHWDEARRQITFASPDKTLVLTVNSFSAALNESAISLPVPPIIYDGITMVPMQYVVETFGGTVAKAAAAPTVFPAGGAAVAAGARLTLTTVTGGATIHYTLDGSAPTAGSPAYAGPITINGAITLKAVAVKNGMENSAVLTASYTMAVPINSTAVDVDQDNKDLAITEATLQLSDPVNVTVPGSVTDAKISVAALMNENPDGTITTGGLPALNIAAHTDISETDPVEVAIPAGAKIVNAPAGWNGTINVPAVQPKESVTVDPDSGNTATVDTVIEIGFGDVPLTFDRAVRILIPGQAGKDVGYSRGGKFTKITAILDADSQEAGDALPPGGDGKIDAENGSDLVVWTKHFTKFVTYTQTVKSGSSGGGGGGPSPVASATGTAMVPPGAGGAVSLGDEAAIIIPANALQGSDKVEVKIQKAAQPPAAPAGFRLAGAAYRFSVGGADSYNFNRTVTLTFSFDPAALAPDEKAEIYYYDTSAGTWVNLGGTVSGNTIAVAVAHFSIFAVLIGVPEVLEIEPKPRPTEPRSGDSLTDIAGHWAEGNINKLVSLGAVAGYPDGSFKPDSTITRAEFATVLAKAFKLAPQSGKEFADTAGHWARDYIAAAAAGGIVSGYDDTTFGPDDLITREQMAVMIVKAAGLSPAAGETSFADSGSISVWAGEAVAAAVENGIISGYPDHTVRPLGNATRAEAATVIVKALDFKFE